MLRFVSMFTIFQLFFFHKLFNYLLQLPLALFSRPRVNAVALPCPIRIHRRIFALPGVLLTFEMHPVPGLRFLPRNGLNTAFSGVWSGVFCPSSGSVASRGFCVPNALSIFFHTIKLLLARFPFPTHNGSIRYAAY